ncbi:ABC transporter substrate-binding protein [Streptomyces sp. NPDC090306]|uniref:ABC transporter substrate-binding protein n=1 Tax=Streptomyces sp. NPDC090306 TaxID=3365961 RepID=UPI00380ED475
MRRHLVAAAVVTAAALSLAACGTTESASSGDTASPASKKITVTDATGTKVTLDGPATKVVGTEWSVLENLVQLGVDPVGASDVKGYNSYDTAEPLKSSTKDIGTRGEPSMDTIASLSPDLIVATTDLSASALKQLRKVAPVITVKSADAADQIGQMTKNLDMIAKATGTTAKATAIEKQLDTKIAEGKQKIADAGLTGSKIAFADAYVVSNQVTVRAYTSGSMLGAVNEELGLKNAWTLKGDAAYGLASTDVEGLTKLGDVQFAYEVNDADGDPFTDQLAKNSVWKSLPFVKDDKVHRLHDGIWMFGGPAAAESYIDAIVDTLTK